MDQNDWDRLGMIVVLAEKMRGDFGRTALMKFAYLLQTLKQVHLGYDFTLYSYGPFDSSVLDDLSYATTLGAIKERTVNYTSSYGYDIKPAENAQQIKQKAWEFLHAHETEIDWVIKEFGSCSAGELELISTIIYADREMSRKQTPQGTEGLASTVHKIKPHFLMPQVERRIQELGEREFLSAV